MAFVPIDALIDPMVIPADGVVFAWEMHGEQSREIQPDQVDAALGDQSKSLWLHLNLSNGRIQRWLRQTPQIPDSLKEAILDQVSRSRMETIEEFGDGLMMVMNDFRIGLTHAADDEETGTLWAIMTPRLMLSLRAHPLMTTDTLRHLLRQKRITPNTVVALYHELIEERATHLRRKTDHLSDQMDLLEEILIKGENLPEHETLGRLRITCSRLRRHYAPELTALRRLLRRKPTWFTEDDTDQLREQIDLLSFLVDEVNNLYERAKVLQDELSAHVAEFNAKNLQVLSVMTVIFLPMTLVTGVMGMNMEDLPGLQNSFYIVMAIMCATGLAVYSGLKIKRVI
ncbi:MAG: CorA family divalent cation transporter [Fluviibacter sp.]